MSNKVSKSILYTYDKFLQQKMEGQDFVLKDIEEYLIEYPFFKLIANFLPTSLNIIDYSTNFYLYVGENCENLLGFTQEEYYKAGRALSVSQIHADDLKVYSSEIFQEYISCSNSIPKEELPFCRFSLCLRMKRKDGHYITILQQFVVLETTEEGYPLISMGLMTDISSHITSSKVVFSITKYKDGICNTLFTSETQTRTIENITSREHEVLLCITNGLSSKAIAEKLILSLHTVNAHRRSLLSKTNSKNSIELIEYALKNGIS